MWQRLRDFLQFCCRGQKRQEKQEDEPVCCEQNLVHIAYRGISDERLYMVRNRNWEEVRFFKPNGLRVFCVRCRQRLL